MIHVYLGRTAVYSVASYFVTCGLHRLAQLRKTAVRAIWYGLLLDALVQSSVKGHKYPGSLSAAVVSLL